MRHHTYHRVEDVGVGGRPAAQRLAAGLFISPLRCARQGKSRTDDGGFGEFRAEQAIDKPPQNSVRLL